MAQLKYLPQIPGLPIADFCGHPLFCVAEEAKPFVRKFMNSKDTGFFRFVVSRSHPNESNKPKTELDEDETPDTEFVGASNEECQRWALEIGSQLKYIDQTLIVIADERSAQDDTISLQYYPYIDELTVYKNFGPLPPVGHVWYEWRIHYQDCQQATSHLTFGDFCVVQPTYFGLKDELEDERGLFNIAEANALISGKDKERLGGVVDWNLVGPHL